MFRPTNQQVMTGLDASPPSGASVLWASSPPCKTVLQKTWDMGKSRECGNNVDMYIHNVNIYKICYRLLMFHQFFRKGIRVGQFALAESHSEFGFEIVGHPGIFAQKGVSVSLFC